MKTGRGGKRKGAGRPATGRKERITIQPTKDNLEWLRSQKESYSSILNRLMDEARYGNTSP
jgi:hypothetical protein